MISLDQARLRVLSRAVPLGPERVALARAAGRVLAAELRAPAPLPPFDASAMDGYAVRSDDLRGQGPWTLAVRGESAAGAARVALAPGGALRIFTGGALPAGADAVLMQEEVARAGDAITFSSRPRVGQHVRQAGEDLAAHAVALPAGSRLTAGALALAAMLDRPELSVSRRPLVTIVCTGDELRAPGDPPRPGSIPESNSAALAALVRQAGGRARMTPLVPDEAPVVLRAIEQALRGTDVLVTVGGVSVGDRDLVRPALEQAGVTMDFWKVAIKPGKPLALGSAGPVTVLGLPGNPASALVTFALFGMPLLRALQGDSRPMPAALRVPMAASRKRPTDRVELVRAALRAEGATLSAHAHDNQASGAATSLAASDGLAVVEPGAQPLPAGEPVDFLRWVDF